MSRSESPPTDPGVLLAELWSRFVTAEIELVACVLAPEVEGVRRYLARAASPRAVFAVDGPSAVGIAAGAWLGSTRAAVVLPARSIWASTCVLGAAVGDFGAELLVVVAGETAPAEPGRAERVESAADQAIAMHLERLGYSCGWLDHGHPGVQAEGVPRAWFCPAGGLA